VTNRIHTFGIETLNNPIDSEFCLRIVVFVTLILGGFYGCDDVEVGGVFRFLLVGHLVNGS